MGAWKCVLLLFTFMSCTEKISPSELHVFAASSLREVMLELQPFFQRAHPGTHVRFHFAGTQELRTQIEHGALADVFLSADSEHMQILFMQKSVDTPHTFTHNELRVVLTTEAGAHISSFKDLPSAQRWVLGAPNVPVGRYARIALARAGMWESIAPKVISNEFNVKHVLMKVRSKDADAGIVYATDVRGLSDVKTLRFPPEANVRVSYEAATVNASKQKLKSIQWVTWLLSDEAQAIFQQHGFLSETQVAQ